MRAWKGKELAIAAGAPVGVPTATAVAAPGGVDTVDAAPVAAGADAVAAGAAAGAAALGSKPGERLPTPTVPVGVKTGEAGQLLRVRTGDCCCCSCCCCCPRELNLIGVPLLRGVGPVPIRR